MPRVPSPRPPVQPPRGRRPFRRRAWTLTITSALLAVVWVGSMKVYLTYANKTSMVGFVRGTLLVHKGDVFSLGYKYGFATYSGFPMRASWWYSYRHDTTLMEPETYWHFPLWPFILLTGVPGVWMLIKTRKHTNPHACPACGYDRTGLPQSPIGPAPCPECGKT